jgi:hypothetical protein
MTGYTEPSISRATGIKKHRLVAARREHLEKGIDWATENHVVTYTESGLVKLCESLGLDQILPIVEKISSGEGIEPAEAAPGESGPIAAETEPAETVAQVAQEIEKTRGPIEIELTRTQLPNPTVVIGKRLDTGELVTVKVRSNANFIPGLIVQASPVNRFKFFNQIGRPPRWRGDRHGFTRTPAKK